MYTHLVIFYTANYCQKIRSFFNVDYLVSQAHLDVEFWDLSDITAHEHLAPVAADGVIERKISSYDSLNNEIRRLSSENCLYMSFVDYAFFSYKVYRALSRYNADILYATSGVLPYKDVSVSSKIFRILTGGRLMKAIRIYSLRFLLKTPLYKEARFVLISCNNASWNYKVGSSTEFLCCSSGDYNGARQILQASESPYIAFIDQYVPFHNDQIINGVKMADADRYYSRLNKLFDAVEKKYNCHVVICAHPSATKYTEHNYFNGRKIVYNATAQYAKSSIGVITHFSTAMSFAVITHKPIMLVTTDELNATNNAGYTLMEYTKVLLNVPFYNLDHESDVSFRDVDVSKYDQYLHDYLIMPGAKDVSNGQIIEAIAKNNYSQYIIK